MTVDAGLDLCVKLLRENTMSHLVRALLANGWVLNDGEKCWYLAEGDVDDFDWQTRPIADRDQVLEVVDQKVGRGEMVGVVLTWRDTCVGGNLLAYPDGTVIFSAMVNRRLVSGFSDVSWYLTRLLPGIRDVAIVLAWKWEESMW